LTTRRFAVALLLLIGLGVTAGFASAAREEANVQRYGMVIGLKPEKLKAYKKLHANPWESVNKAIKEAKIRNYSIYLTKFDDGKLYLFGYFEYTGADFQADMKKMAADAEIQRWWKETDPCQIALESRKEGAWWKTMDEVYHLD
jgi:L-rhamnose mutarotase